MTHVAPDQPVEMAFPPLFHAVDEVSAEAQTLLLRLRALEFISLVAAAAFAALPGDILGRIGPILTLLFFALALILRVSGFDITAERRWYEGRAAAESLKSMSWQYAAAGESFRRDDPDSDIRYVANMTAILRELGDLDIPFPSADDTAIPVEMQTLRDSSVAHRIDVYQRLRVRDQLGWYQRKAAWNKRRARQWRAGTIAIESAAVLLGLGRVFGWYDVDWLGIFAAVAATLAAWQQTKNYQGLSRAYAVTSHDVALVNAAIGQEASEDAWAQALHDAEAAFSREHTMWLARRQGPSTS